MVKVLNNKFIKQLIDSDFIFSKVSSKNQILSSIDLSIVLNKKNKIHILDVFRLNSSLKQFISILKLLKSANKFCIYIWCANSYFVDLINKFTKEYFKNKKIIAFTTFPQKFTKKDLSQKQNGYFLFILGRPSFTKSEQLISRKFIQNHIFLINRLNYTFEKYNFGIYKIQNDLSDYKKLLFLLAIIHNILKK